MTPSARSASGEVVAIVPARGGSKGIPGKNLVRVGGVPLVARAVIAANEAEGVDRVVVTTDDDAIAAAARESGAHVVRRPSDISGDGASSESALLHALESLGSEPRAIAFLQATSPFIDVPALSRAVRMVRTGEADSAFSAVETYGFLWASGADGATGINHDPSHRPRRQEREPHYLESGAFYVLDTVGFRSTGHRFFGRTVPVQVDERTAIEIDSPEQLDIARALAPLAAEPTSVPFAVDAVVTDFDGVHTDDRVTVSSDGIEHVRVSRSDGMGVRLLREAGIDALILSTETNPVVTARARKLRIDVLQAQDDKASALRTWADARGIPLKRVAYLGNDVNDLPVLEIVGWPVAVSDAHPLVLAAARLVLERAGGSGAVRELADRVLRSRGAARNPFAAAQQPAQKETP
ncbi:acylneuraminate cytidylyltransferase [Microbacterium halotolerans]|uniref:acylneuraminate cytidylyltransferase n=1 Tax=Microbacterium halotolerans TaxID=246613 RepID=UPI001F091659|nr:acylneuraminate cytidylyltransferase [Microbacterium halotolerans]